MSSGSHTLTHPNLAALDEADSGQEVIAEKALIEARALCWIGLFPSPLGKPDDHSPASIEAVKHVGHAGAVTTSLGVKVGLAQRLEAHRIQAMGSDEATFAVALARFHLDAGRP